MCQKITIYFFFFESRTLMLESRYQAKLIKRIEHLFPGCYVIKNDPNYIQGFPDLTILYGQKWAVLECKKNKFASHQPNQDYYVKKLNNMSFSAFIYPENEEDILYELQQAFSI